MSHARWELSKGRTDVIRRENRRLTARLGLLLFVAVVAASGCSGDSDDGTTTSATESGAAVSADGGTTTVEDPDDGSATTGAGASDDSGGGSDGVMTAEQEHAAIDIAGAYFVSRTDFTRDQFEWKVEAAAQDDDGQWWARVSATPKGGVTLETEQVYVYNPAGSSFWFAHDMGTGIDPATDESFPEEVRDRL